MTQIGRHKDTTIEQNYLRKWRHLISEYELVKSKKHPQFRFVQDFYRLHGLKRQNFIKYYNRYKYSGIYEDCLPQKRGPKYHKRCISEEVEDAIVYHRKEHGLNRYEIHSMLGKICEGPIPSSSTVYNIFKKHSLNRLNPPMKEAKRKIIKEKAGELGHIDCHYLPKNLIENDPKRYYLVALVDSCSRIAWAEVMDDIKSITVMFATLRLINMINVKYKIQFAEVLTDNGSEFGSGPSAKNKQQHPFERMLLELGIKHRYTKPARPQTNGKVERFWRTLNEDLIEGVVFDSMDHFKRELEGFLLYYNELRPHQGINAMTPKKFLESCHRNT